MPSNLRLCVVLSAFGLGLGWPSHAAPIAACTSEMSRQGESSLSEAALNWSQLSKHQSMFEACDDGGLAEGYSDVVVRLLSNKWSDLSEFAAIARSRPAFHTWVIKHIDATVSTKDLQKIIFNASSRCGDPKLREVCRQLSQAAQKALQVQDQGQGQE